MKRLSTANISASVAMPIKSGTLEFIQDAYKEAFTAMITNITELPVTGTIYILSGCRNTSTAPIYTITAGWVYYNGEIYQVPAASFTLTGLQKAYARIDVTQFITNADPVQFTDGIDRNVHNIRRLVIEGTITSSGLPEFQDFVRLNHWLKGDTKEVVCDGTYISTYFDGTGLGRLERTGWAIMNGNNGTVNDDGLVVIAYGATNATPGATGGSKDAVLVSHNHTTPNHTHTIETAGSDSGVGYPVNGSPLQAGEAVTTNSGGGGVTSTVGVSGTDKNMQPYVVRLRIQKIL